MDGQIARAFETYGWAVDVAERRGTVRAASAWWWPKTLGGWYVAVTAVDPMRTLASCDVHHGQDVHAAVGRLLNRATDALIGNQSTRMVEAKRDVEAGEMVTTKDIAPLQFKLNVPESWLDTATAERRERDIIAVLGGSGPATRAFGSSASAVASRGDVKPLPTKSVIGTDGIERTYAVRSPRRHNTTCPRCNGPAYQGLGAVQCEREDGCLADAAPAEVGCSLAGCTVFEVSPGVYGGTVHYAGHLGPEPRYFARGHGGESGGWPTRDLAVAAWRKAVLDRAWGRA